MSIMEDILKGALSKAIGGGDSAPAATDSGIKGDLVKALIPIVIGLLADGGLSKILSNMQANGFTAEADSWISDAPNKPITADQARAVVGDSEISRIAAAVGLDEGQTAALVAEALPDLVDKASPAGDEPPAVEVAEILKGL